MLIKKCCSLRLKTEKKKHLFFFFPRQGILGHPVTFLFHYSPPEIFYFYTDNNSIYRAQTNTHHPFVKSGGKCWTAMETGHKVKCRYRNRAQG